MSPLQRTHKLFSTLAIVGQFHVAAAQLRNDVSREIYNLQNTTPNAESALPTQMTMNDSTTEAVYTPEPIYTTEYASGSCLAPTTTRSIHSIVIPSPGASPIEITAQSQVVTSYIPEMTWCVAPAMAVWPITNGPPYLNSSTTEYSTSYEGTGRCETVFAPIQTTVCATTLTGIGSKISVTDCEQQVTFSTECGFSLERPTPTPATTGFSSLITPAPSVRRLFTYYLAPWQALTAGDTPSDVDVKICTEQDNGTQECVRYQEVWEVVIVTSTRTTERTIQVSTTVSGPGTLIVETMTSTVTDTIESIDLSTVLQLETEVETESISSGRKPTATVRSTQEVTTTIYVTRHLKHASSDTSEPTPELTTELPTEPTPEGTSTVWVTSTSTTHVTGTITMKRPRPAPRMAEFVPY
ncbi:hypothetical protein IAQ61_000498 [Plenodomus lingam]|uniref:Uncharacterized protein n=1 Tax=Leptosphaeria maculans (strain JN3 / isolate v23.1.3 / race Av1-4-5-6-7-8) TaxID=985895 RepID=E5A703_LEPMJ|nr:predicted protein [Plenodomus lingam JN3]KAH9880209.1 hypothetical protein IAQ61_000498 [Plenodomus lingam]CBX99398.1 predicted protein [Plenodomus lingam JN3]